MSNNSNKRIDKQMKTFLIAPDQPNFTPSDQN